MKKNNIKRLFLGVFFVVNLFSLYSAPKSELWEFWDRSNEEDGRIIDHNQFQVFLDEYRIKESPSDVAKIKYSSVTDKDKQLLLQYIEDLSQLNILNYRRDEQFAFWVNLYNALTVNLILENYPLKSIRKIYKPWDRILVEILGQELTLNDIEHRILRPRWKDPRIHFVVNCASLGCPDIPGNVMTAATFEDILKDSTANFFGHERAVSLKRGRLVLSSIFDWYSVDFGGSKKNVIEYISLYNDFISIEKTTGKSRYDLKVQYDYDWDLNEYED